MLYYKKLNDIHNKFFYTEVVDKLFLSKAIRGWCEPKLKFLLNGSVRSKEEIIVFFVGTSRYRSRVSIFIRT
jgi:hypothetical protein